MSEVKFIKGDRYVGPNGEDLGAVEVEAVKSEVTEAEESQAESKGKRPPTAKADAGK